MSDKFITRADMQSRINFLREELENRYKYGTVKVANADGTPVDTLTLQNELYALIYRKSRSET